MRALPESYIAVNLRSLQTPLKGPHQQVCPALKVPNRLLTSWDIIPGEGHLYTRDHGLLTVMSRDDMLGERVLERQVQRSKLITLPPDLGRAHAGPNEVSTPVGIVDWDQENQAIITSPRIIAQRIGAVSLTEIRAPDREVLSKFADAVLEGRLRHEVVLDASQLKVSPSQLMPELFPELNIDRNH